MKLKLSEVLGGGKGSQKVFLLALAVLGIFLLLLGHLDTGGGGREATPVGTLPASEPESSSPGARLQIQSEEEYLAQRLEALLQQITGVGEVQVSVRLESSTTSEYAVNHSTGRKVSDENDPEGVVRVTTDVNETGELVVVRGDNGYEIPVVERELSPRVTGVLVVAEGARNPAVKAQLFRATRVALGVEPHKILVLPKKF